MPISTSDMITAAQYQQQRYAEELYRARELRALGLGSLAGMAGLSGQLSQIAQHRNPFDIYERVLSTPSIISAKDKSRKFSNIKDELQDEVDKWLKDTL